MSKGKGTGLEKFPASVYISYNVAKGTKIDRQIIWSLSSKVDSPSEMDHLALVEALFLTLFPSHLGIFQVHPVERKGER